MGIYFRKSVQVVIVIPCDPLKVPGNIRFFDWFAKLTVCLNGTNSSDKTQSIFKMEKLKMIWIKFQNY